MSCRASIRKDGNGIHLDQPFGPGQRRDDDAGRDWKDTLEMLTDHPIDSLSIARIDDIDRDLANVLERRTRLLEQRLNVSHGLVGLSRSVADTDAFRSLEVLA